MITIRRSKKENEAHQAKIYRHAQVFVTILSVIAWLGVSYFLWKGATVALRKSKEFLIKLSQPEQKATASIRIENLDDIVAGVLAINEITSKRLQGHLNPYF